MQMTLFGINYEGDSQYFGFFCSLRFQIFKQLCFVQILAYPNKPYINIKIIYTAFRISQISRNVPSCLGSHIIENKLMGLPQFTMPSARGVWRVSPDLRTAGVCLHVVSSWMGLCVGLWLMITLKCSTVPSSGCGKPRLLKRDSFFPEPEGINRSVNCRDGKLGEVKFVCERTRRTRLTN